MARHWTLIVGLALLAVLSGCQTGAESGDSVPGPDVQKFPAGTERSGITSPDALLETHQQSIRTTGYVRTGNWDWKQTNRNNTYKSSFSERRLMHDCSGDCLSDSDGTSFSYYRVDSDVFAKEHPAGIVRTEYTRYYPKNPFNKSHVRIGTPHVLHYIEGNETSLERTFTRDNRTFLVYSVRSPRDQERAVNGSVVVRQDGLITELKLRVEDEVGVVDRFRIRIEPSKNLHVPEPAWKSKAKAATTITVSASGNVCDNDGVQSYDEDDDRDNDGLCDEG